MEFTIFLKVLLGAFLGSVIGFEREISHKVAGLRTHALVCLASSLLAAISVDGFKEYIGSVNYDPSRIVSNIIVGIGFIGAGAILRQEGKVQGTTTAASLWAVAAIGITVGLGFYKDALLVTGTVFLVLRSLWVIEHKLRKRMKLREDEQNR